MRDMLLQIAAQHGNSGDNSTVVVAIGVVVFVGGFVWTAKKGPLGLAFIVLGCVIAAAGFFMQN